MSFTGQVLWYWPCLASCLLIYFKTHCYAIGLKLIENDSWFFGTLLTLWATEHISQERYRGQCSWHQTFLFMGKSWSPVKSHFDVKCSTISAVWTSLGKRHHLIDVTKTCARDFLCSFHSLLSLTFKISYTRSLKERNRVSEEYCPKCATMQRYISICDIRDSF